MLKNSIGRTTETDRNLPQFRQETATNPCTIIKTTQIFYVFVLVDEVGQVETLKQAWESAILKSTVRQTTKFPSALTTTWTSDHNKSMHDPTDHSNLSSLCICRRGWPNVDNQIEATVGDAQKLHRTNHRKRSELTTI